MTTAEMQAIAKRLASAWTKGHHEGAVRPYPETLSIEQVCRYLVEVGASSWVTPDEFRELHDMAVEFVEQVWRQTGAG